MTRLPVDPRNPRQHLSPEELIEHLDGALRADRAAHADVCDDCRREGESLAALFKEARAVDVPEPSPLFWDRFSARVREGIDAPAAPQEGWPDAASIWRRSFGRLVFAGGVLAAAFTVALSLWRAPQPPSATVSSREVEAAAADEADSEWALFITVTDDVDWDTATEAGLGVRPGAAERAVSELSDTEQIELARLLRAELGRSRS